MVTGSGLPERSIGDVKCIILKRYFSKPCVETLFGISTYSSKHGLLVISMRDRETGKKRFREKNSSIAKYRRIYVTIRITSQARS